MAKAKTAVPLGYHTVTPMLVLDEARKAIDWYREALGVEEVSSYAGPDGKIMHAELKLGDSRIMLHDEMMGARSPRTLGGSPISLWIYVPDCDALFERAVKAGGQVRMAMEDQFWGDRSGVIEDPFGYAWTIATRKEDLTEQELMERQAKMFG